MSTQGASVVVVVPTLGSRHSQAINWTKLNFYGNCYEINFLELLFKVNLKISQSKDYAKSRFNCDFHLFDIEVAQI